MRPSYHPEDELLIACARTSLSTEHKQRIRELAAGRLDWERVFVAARRHGLAPLVARHVAGACGGALPAAAERLFPPYLESRARFTLALTAELLRILAAMEAAGIVAVPYKGPVLAAAVYGDVALREFNDLDILICQGDLPRAVPVVTSLGYRADFHPALVCPDPRPAPGQYPFRHPALPCLVEFHTECTLRYFARPVDFAPVWQRRESVAVGGQAVASLAAEDLLLFLCVHGAKDFWERLVWVADVAELARARTGMDWEAAQERARALGVERLVRVGLALAQTVLGAELPAAVEARVRRDRAARALAQRLGRRLLRHAAGEPGLLERLLIRVRSGDSLLQGLRHTARLTFAATDEDRDALPAGLRGSAPLHALLRPLRLLHKHGLRGRPAAHS